MSYYEVNRIRGRGENPVKGRRVLGADGQDQEDAEQLCRDHDGRHAPGRECLAHAPPGRRRLGGRRIAAGQEHLKLVRLQTPRPASSIRHRPEPEAPRREPLLAQPEALAVIDEYLQRPASPVAEHEHGAAHRVGFKPLPAYPSQPVDALAKVRRLHGHEYSQVRSELHHGISPRPQRRAAPAPTRPPPQRSRRARECAAPHPRSLTPPRHTPPTNSPGDFPREAATRRIAVEVGQASGPSG